MSLEFVDELFDGSIVTTEFVPQRGAYVSTVRPPGGLERELVRPAAPTDQESARLDHSRILRELTADHQETR